MAGTPIRDGGPADDDGAADPRRDRQVLVVGDGPAAAATAGFLDRAGLDPVLAGSTGDRAPGAVVTLWRPGLVVLDRLGLRRPVERRGTRLDRLRRPATGAAWTADPADRPVLLAIRRADLDDLLDRRVRDRVRTAGTRVAAVDTTDAGVVATFERGVRESFDAVVTADPTLAPVPEAVTAATAVHAWAFEWPASGRPPTDPTEAWGRDRAAFVTPVGDGARVRLVAVDGPTPAVDVDALERRFGRLFAGVGDPFATLDEGTLRYRRSPRVAPASMRADGVALVGRAARAALPGDCLGPTLAVEDAWVVADELAYGAANRGAALEAYDARRRRRERELRRRTPAATPLDPATTDLSPLLRRLSHTRSLAFGHVTGRVPDTARTAPESL
jgi:2-polyprenyl-6-methoxyphenol hydroxylase-like FAD-dependent oxidoreductase